MKMAVLVQHHSVHSADNVVVNWLEEWRGKHSQTNNNNDRLTAFDPGQPG